MKWAISDSFTLLLTIFFDGFSLDPKTFLDLTSFFACLYLNMDLLYIWIWKEMSLAVLSGTTGRKCSQLEPECPVLFLEYCRCSSSGNYSSVLDKIHRHFIF